MSQELFTQIKMNKIDKGNLLASGSVLIAGTVEVKFTVMKGSKGPFVSLPRRSYEKDGETKWANEVYLPDEEVRNTLQTVVMAEYNKDTKKTSKKESRGDGIPF